MLNRISARKTASLLASIAVTTLLGGCGSGVVYDYAAESRMIGNWQLTATAPARMPRLAGSFDTQATKTVFGMFHQVVVPGQNVCSNPNQIIGMSAYVDGDSNLSISSGGIDGGVLQLTGKLAPDGNSVNNVVYNIVAGSNCQSGPTPATLVKYTPLQGTYIGALKSQFGGSSSFSAAMKQTENPDQTGAFHIHGQASFSGSNTCLVAPVISESTVSGSQVSATYTETNGPVTTTVKLNGTFNPEATVLNVSNYTITGGACDGDTGSAVLTRQ